MLTHRWTRLDQKVDKNWTFDIVWTCTKHDLLRNVIDKYWFKLNFPLAFITRNLKILENRGESRINVSKLFLLHMDNGRLQTSCRKQKF